MLLYIFGSVFSSVFVVLDVIIIAMVISLLFFHMYATEPFLLLQLHYKEELPAINGEEVCGDQLVSTKVTLIWYLNSLLNFFLLLCS